MSDDIDDGMKIEWTSPHDVQTLVLAQYLGVDPEEISDGYDIQHYEDGQAEYLVVTDSEADELWDQALNDYIEECILHELPEQYRFYFDEDKWKRDAHFDGRGHSLSSYDGNEEERQLDMRKLALYAYEQLAQEYRDDYIDANEAKLAKIDEHIESVSPSKIKITVDDTDTAQTWYIYRTN